MTHIGIDLEIADGAWRREFGDALAADLMSEHLATIERVGCLARGMRSGEPAFEVAVRLQDGRVLVAETSWRMIRAAVRALETRWPLDGGDES